VTLSTPRLRQLSPRLCRRRPARPWRSVLAVLLILGALLPARDARAEAVPTVQRGDVPLRAWYFAEGNSRSGFETYITLVNLSDQPAGVTAEYNRDDGIRLMQWLGIEPRARVSLNANDVVGLGRP
jgi:hypothetical protein